MMGWGRNLRFALRTLRKAPEFTVTTVLLIGLGVGAVTTIFTLVDHILLRPLPYPDSDRIVLVDNGSHSGPLFNGLQGLNSVEAWAGARVEDASLVGEGEPLRIEQAEISRGFFSPLGARPALGRLLAEDDFTATNVAVVSHGTWQRVFGSDAGVVGRTIRIDGEPVTIVGVLDGTFEPPNALVGNQVDVWRPIDWTREVYTATNYRVLEIVGRAARGVTIADIQAETDALIERFARLYPESFVNREGDVQYTPIVGLHETTVARVQNGLRHDGPCDARDRCVRAARHGGAGQLVACAPRGPNQPDRDPEGRVDVDLVFGEVAVLPLDRDVLLEHQTAYRQSIVLWLDVGQSTL